MQCIALWQDLWAGENLVTSTLIINKNLETLGRFEIFVYLCSQGSNLKL